MWEPEEPKAETERKGQESKSVDAVFVNNSLGTRRRHRQQPLLLPHALTSGLYGPGVTLQGHGVILHRLGPPRAGKARGEKRWG